MFLKDASTQGHGTAQRRPIGEMIMSTLATFDDTLSGVFEPPHRVERTRRTPEPVAEIDYASHIAEARRLRSMAFRDAMRGLFRNRQA